MTGQMCWLAPIGSAHRKILHLRTHPTLPWRPYHQCLEFMLPDYDIPEGSAGMATFQELLREGWQLLPSAGQAPLAESA
ncbi:hypothetical protein [Gloeobacter kilaueensis]|uniref:Uncharacterized protein n=1 Tax=Gloeobacter kilaueensis (strain ATCC BAA-2537 / CCAP 1431/1 / ULC 316 / JS1) TaxID=1183438 RepID=U5QN65_GLOK1|nr:hypothetical protein [Gloeobacter kilaueensis]AGY59049.1 hypothetical protein GKIL_2803 [Gloeobacter kilaueensis JS1]